MTEAALIALDRDVYHVRRVATRGGSMAVRVLLVLTTFAVLYGCGQASSPVEKQEKQGGVEQAKPEPVASKECSDFASGQEAFVFEQSGKATEADK